MEEQELIKHIERHEASPLIRNALMDGRRVSQEVQDFYGLETTIFLGAGRIPQVSYYLKSTSEKRKSGLPEEIVEIVNPFCKNPLAPNLLNYEDVRENFSKWEKHREKDAILLIPTGFISLLVGVVNYFAERPILGIPMLALGVGGIVFPFFYPRELKKSEISSLEEYIKLYRGTLNTDRFIENNYKNYFVRENLKP